MREERGTTIVCTLILLMVFEALAGKQMFYEMDSLFVLLQTLSQQPGGTAGGGGFEFLQCEDG